MLKRLTPFEQYLIWLPVLLTGLYFLIAWEPVKENSHSYETQNIFGTKHKNYYSTEVSFYDKEKMLKEIENHKYYTKEKWDKFFKRKPKDKAEKVTYL